MIKEYQVFYSIPAFHYFFPMLFTVLQFVDFIIRALIGLIIVKSLMSWFIRNPYNPVMRVMDSITEPILSPIRRMMPATGRIDFSPIIAIIALNLLGKGITYLVFTFFV